MVCVCIAAGVLGCGPAVAGAAQCGEAGSGDEPLTGTLLLRSEESTTELSFKRDTGVRRLIFVFDVKECRLSTDAQVGVKVRSSDLEADSVFDAPIIEPEGSLLTVEVPVDPEGFDAGKHPASVTVRGAEIAPTAAKVSLQRSESPGIPTLIFLVCAFAGWVAAMLVCGVKFSFRGSRPTVFKRLRKAALALVAALIAAGAVWWASYVEAEVWELELETAGVMAIAALPAAYGAAIQVLREKKA